MSVYSYSKLDLYEQCPFKFKLRYLDKYNFYSDSIATEFGTLVHNTEENIAKYIMSNSKINYIELRNNFVIKMHELKYKYSDAFFTKDKSGQTYEEKANSYLDSTIYNLEKLLKENPTYSIVGVEKPFNFKYNDKYNFQGFIDRILYDSSTNKYIIQDIKTYPQPVEQNKLATPLQFVIYTMAVISLYNCQPQDISCQYYLPLCNITQNAGTTNYLTRGDNKICKLFDKIELNNFEPNPSPLCNYCDFCYTNKDAPEAGKFLCPYYSLWNKETRKKSDISKVENKWEGLEKHQQILESHLQKYGISI